MNITMGDMNEPSSSLQLGLAALKRQDYAEAIAILKSVQQSTPSAPTRARAEMGLVKAYAQMGDREEASALCQLLCSHANSQVQSWAKQTLGELNQLSAEVQSEAQSTPADITGFVPFTDALPQPRQSIAGVKPAEKITRSTVSVSPKSEEPPQSKEAPESKELPKPKDSQDSLYASTRSPLSEALVVTEIYLPPEPRAIQTTVRWKQAGRAKKWTNLG
ncbi:MAG: tetratricopeptide repeat protein, partial [Cyanobacteria bacterium CAN_BIN43]|nr:tetratricopeptide repeat protein [Cyanobacteria bacterium CAN_BIN43]